MQGYLTKIRINRVSYILYRILFLLSQNLRRLQALIFEIHDLKIWKFGETLRDK